MGVMSIISYNCDGFSQQKSEFICGLIDDNNPDIPPLYSLDSKGRRLG